MRADPLRLLSLIILLLLAASGADTSTFDALRRLAPEPETPPAVGGLRETPPEPPVAELLDPCYADADLRTQARSKAEWQRRLKARGGDASFAIVSPLDGARELLVFVPGVGMHFQDAHAIVRLDDEYQVAIVVVDESRPIPEAGLAAATALERLAREHGYEGRPLRVVGHSFGAPIAHFMLKALAERGRIGEGRAFPRVLFVGIDGPWRGVDTPLPTLAPGVRQAWEWAFIRLPLRKPPTRGTLSIINRLPGMRALQGAELPPEVTTHYVSVLGNQRGHALVRHYVPVSSWFSEELGAGELERLWKVLRDDPDDWNAYDTWAVTGLARKQGLQNLQRTLRRDADYAELGKWLLQAALESASPAEFRPRYDAILAEIVDTFHGHHTNFMWEDPAFLPYLRGRLR